MDKPKYNIWAIILRGFLMLIPFIVMTICDYLAEKCEKLLYWLNAKLPQAEHK